MANKSLLEKLDKATNNAVKIALNKCIPIPISKKSSLVGNFVVEKQSDGDFSIKTLENSTIYNNISGYDVAVIICQRSSLREHNTVNRILMLDSQYQRYRSEMLYLLNCMKSASKRRDYMRMAILEDKFQMAESMAKKIKNSISFFKKTK